MILLSLLYSKLATYLLLHSEEKAMCYWRLTGPYMICVSPIIAHLNSFPATCFFSYRCYLKISDNTPRCIWTSRPSHVLLSAYMYMLISSLPFCFLIKSSPQWGWFLISYMRPNLPPHIWHPYVPVSLFSKGPFLYFQSV